MPEERPTETTKKTSARQPKQVVGFMLIVLALAATPLIAGLVRDDVPAPTKKVVDASETQKGSNTPKKPGNEPADKGSNAKAFPPKSKRCKPKGRYGHPRPIKKQCRGLKN